MPSIEDRCSLRSDARDERLAGTASTIARWLLVEFADPWGHHGLLDGRLPPQVGRALHEVATASRARVLLIRRVDRRPDVEGRVTCICVDARGPEPWMGRRSLATLGSATDVDLDDRAAFEPLLTPVAVVCTHGKRDVCCAERGRPLALATAAAYPDTTWESTHVGGDRFAGNLVLFPHALYFGRVEAARGPEIVGAYAGGRIVLDRFRGRATVPMYAQAAEIHLRRQLSLDGIDDVVVRSATREGEERLVELRAAGAHHLLRVRRRLDPPMRLTCHSASEESPVGWDVVS